jgi:hypothetical protein
MKKTLAYVVILFTLIFFAQKYLEKPAATKKLVITDDSAKVSEIPKEVLDELKKVGEVQSKGLSNATTVIHRVYDYEGYSYYNLTQEQKKKFKLVALDVEFKGKSDGLDLDDVEIVDASTNKSFADSPHIELLDDTGNLAKNQADWPKTGMPLRVLLIYAVPIDFKSVKLSYWGSEIVTTPKVISGIGLALQPPTKP